MEYKIDSMASIKKILCILVYIWLTH